MRRQIFFLLPVLFNTFMLGMPPDSAKEPISSQVFYLKESPFIQGEKVFPETAYTTNIPNEWRVFGYTDGNRLGVRPAIDPETGRPVSEFWFNSRNPKKRWLNWQKKFPSELLREGMNGISVEIYPLTPVPSSLILEFGLPLPIRDIGPAWRGSLGELVSNKWNRIELTRGSNRHPFQTGMRFVMDISKPEVPQNSEVRFLVRNLQPIPETALATNPPSVAVKTSTLIPAAYVQQDSSQELLWGDPITLQLDLAVKSAFKARLHFRLTEEKQNPGNDKTVQSIIAQAQSLEIDLRPPITRIILTYQPPSTGTSFTGNSSLDFIITDTRSKILLKNLAPIGTSFFNDKDFDDRIAQMRDRAKGLSQNANGLSSKGVLVDEPKITLEVANLFLNKFIPDDYYKQKERSIALTLLKQASHLLDKAEAELSDRSAGLIHERPIPYRYNPQLPLDIRNGRIYQGNHPMLFFGPQETSAFDAIPLLPSLGFNSVLIETEGALLKFGNARLRGAIQQASTEGLAAHLLFSTHYITKLPRSNNASHVMMPYDILSPETRPTLHNYYQNILTPLRPLTNLVSIGTANEPGYAIHSSAIAYEAAFQQWLGGRYRSISELNKRWHSSHPAFKDIKLAEDVLGAAKRNPAISYDWECFRAYILGTHFHFMKEEAENYLPNRMIWVKKYHTLGFGQIDPEVLFDQGSTIHDQSSITPLTLDYDRGIEPNAPLSSSEWKLVPGFTPSTLGANPLASNLAMFENYARGLSWGIIWKWARRQWRVMGDHHTFTRYPTAMEEICRTSHRLQQLAPVFDRLSALGDSSVALLFDKASLLHQGEKRYQKDPATGFESIYWRLNRNSEGVRILHAGRATTADFTSRRLIAAGSANALDTQTMHNLAGWVRDGGTLWVTSVGSLALDPWGAPHTDSFLVQFISAAATLGEHQFGKGRIIVSPDWEGYTHFFKGPYVIDAIAGTPITQSVECRFLPVSKEKGTPGYFYILNRTNQKQVVRLIDSATGNPWAIPSRATEIWQQEDDTPTEAPSSVEELTLKPYTVFLFEIPQDANYHISN